MQHTMMAIFGVVCLMISMVSIYKLAPRQGKPSVAWMKVEAIEILVTLVLVTLLALGAAFLFAALA
jgi:hypothetical protein